MKTNHKKTNIAVDGNVLKIITVDGLEYITDGVYRCLVTEGRYEIKKYRNPSGALVPCLQGNRPAEVVVKLGVPLRYRKNIKSLKEANGRRELLIREDAGCEQRTSLVDTSLNLDQVKDAEAALAQLSVLPPPDWSHGNWSFVQAVEYISRHFKPCRNHKLLTEAVAAFIESKDKEFNRAAATLDSLGVTLRRLVEACPDKCVHEVTEEDLRPLIRRGTQVRSMKRHKSVYSNFFSWCASRERSWTPHNPAKAVELPDRADDVHIPQILPVTTVRQLLAEALKFKGGRLFLFCAVAFGCALRPSEMGRIQARRKILGKDSFHFGPNDIENFIEVIGKCRGWRKVQIPPEFVSCIRQFVEAGYPIIPRNFFNDWTHLRALVGYLGSRGYVPDYIDTKSFEPWVDDFPRHTGGSHHLNRSENEHKTARWMGNSPKMLFGHYDGRPTKSDTVEFYQIPGGLKLPTIADLRASGVPDMATDSELKKLKCPVNRHTTFGLKKVVFEQVRALHLQRFPEAGQPEHKGFTRKSGMWSKRRMLELPPRAELLKLFWTFPLSDLAKKYKVTRATMALIADDHDIPLPPIGHWQQRASGQALNEIPEEVTKAFPDGLPRYVAPVGRNHKLDIPSLAEFFRLVWQYPLFDLAPKLNCSIETLTRTIKRLKLPKPGHSYWRAKPQNRRIPNSISRLLSLEQSELEAELRSITNASSGE